MNKVKNNQSLIVICNSQVNCLSFVDNEDFGDCLAKFMKLIGDFGIIQAII